jgi:NADH-ubiquinone oxidoreductase chain 4
MRVVIALFVFSVFKNSIHLFSKLFFFFFFSFSIFFMFSPFLDLISLIQYFILLNRFNFWFTCLTLWGGIVLCSARGFVENLKFLILKFKNMVFLTLVLVIAFNVNSLIGFYFFFEFSLFPILFLILGWGYQPERIFAGYSLVMYTFIASLPLFLMIILFKKIMFSSHELFLESSEIFFFLSINNLFVAALILGFLVKLPVFFVHLWLPRAHVEAPVEGSIILASVMLKLGGYGLLLVSPLLGGNLFISRLRLGFILVGGAVVAVICVRQTDLKTLIAYSSVSHMAMAASASLCIKYLALWASVAAYIRHGFVSSGLFLAANFIYSRAHTRNLMLIKRGLSYIPVFSFFLFIFCMGNMGSPPTPNLVREIFLICSLGRAHYLSFAPVFFLCFLATLFTLNLYIFTQHGQRPFKQRFFKRLSSIEFLNLFNHFNLIFFGGVLIFLLV